MVAKEQVNQILNDHTSFLVSEQRGHSFLLRERRGFVLFCFLEWAFLVFASEVVDKQILIVPFIYTHRSEAGGFVAKFSFCFYKAQYCKLGV